MREPETYLHKTFDHRGKFLLVIITLVLIISSGVIFLDVETTFDEVSVGSEEEAALAQIEKEFAVGEDDLAYAQLILETEDAFAKESLLASLDLQAELRDHEKIRPTLYDESATIGVANIIAIVAIEQAGGAAGEPSLEVKRTAIASMNQAEIDRLVDRVLSSNGAVSNELLQLLPNSFEPGATPESTMMVVEQAVDPTVSSGAASDEIIDSQLAMQNLGEEHPATVYVVGNGLFTHEMNQSTGDTLSLLGPLAFVMVLLVLTVAYRQLIDIVLSLVGIVLVLAWTFGALGWLGIDFNPILIAIPVFLIGLSIDFGIHVLMRYREQQASNSPTRTHAMTSAIAGVGVALLWITVTTVTGFLSNLASPMAPIRELGLMAAVGIIGAFVVFVGVIPPLKLELESRVGLPEQSGDAIGTGDGIVGRSLAGTAVISSRFPVIVIAFMLLVTGVAGVAAMGVDTTFNHEDNIPKSAPAWAESMPGPFGAGEYTIRDNVDKLDQDFLREGNQIEVLVEGDVTDAAVLHRIDEAIDASQSSDAVVTLSGGQPLGSNPLTLMRSLAAEHPSFAEELAASDTTGDGMPDENIDGLYATMMEIAPDRTAAVIHMENGEVQALRMTFVASGEADRETVSDDLRSIATVVDGDGVSAVATGEPITHHIIDQHIIRTVMVSLFITLIVVVSLLMVVFRVVHNSASLGLITLLPVTAAVAWIIATVHLLGYNLDIVTSLTASLTIGIGIDYSIHVSERFRAELAKVETTEVALKQTLRGTGGALLSSAATTAIGFGVLALAVSPMLQQFGIITAIMIGFAFLGAVVFLPSLLAIWAKYNCPTGLDLACERDTAGRTTPGD